MLQTLLKVIFIILFAITPLVFFRYTSELFEYNKMYFVYALTTLIAAVWLLKMAQDRKIQIKRTPLDIPLALFFLSQVISTVLSIDPHTSLNGYYSRLNGGLMSTISYILIYYALVSNFERKDVLTILKSAIFSGVVVAIWAIFEHFGRSLSCLLLISDFNVACWVQDVQSRVFATLGQPNWLAAYLAMLIFPALYFALRIRQETKSFLDTFSPVYTILAILLYAGFTFTFTRGTTLAILAGFGIFFVLASGLIKIIFPSFLKIPSSSAKKKSSFTNFQSLIPVTLVIALLLTVNLLFGSALTGNFSLLKSGVEPNRPTLEQSFSAGGTQLENGGTESWKIRQIVWDGALAIWRDNPLIGTGVETFAHAYYQYRPAEHNLVSEWDFLYNKAHNEYLNFLATTGLIGLATYLSIIAVFLYWAFKQIRQVTLNDDLDQLIFISAIVAAFITNLIHNYALFSVVLTNLFFFTFPALAFLYSGSLKNNFNLNWLQNKLFSRDIYQKAFMVLIVFFAVFTLTSFLNSWRADLFFNNGSNLSDAGNPGRAYNLISEAVSLNSAEPLYQSELAYSAAAAAVALQPDDATLSAELVSESADLMEYVLLTNPKNTSYWRTAIRTYFQLSMIDPEYEARTLETVDQAIKLAPTDVKLYYNKALILTALDRNEEALPILQKALELKPNYLDASFKISEVYSALGATDSAKMSLEKVLKIYPNQPEALERLSKLNATPSAKNQ